MQLKKKLSLVLACVVSICCLNIGAVAAETPWDNNFIEITQGAMRATKTFEVTVGAYGNANANAKDSFSMEAGETVRIRGIYSQWSSAHNISYNEMLVLYTIREKGFCTQKQICDSYLLPRQTMNNVITVMRENGLLELSPENSVGREKAFVLTGKGKEYAMPLLESMNRFEEQAVALLGDEKLAALTSLMLEYDQALGQAMQDVR